MPRTLFSWTVAVEVAVLVVLIGIAGFRHYFQGTTDPADAATINGWDPSTPLPECGDPVLVVDKSDRILVLYDGRREMARFPAAVGQNPGDKEREGDKRTPEGEFYVCMKNPESDFVLSLGLSYPNIEDAERGLRDGLITRKQHDSIVKAIREGKQPPWKTVLGGEIMIHGCRNGGRGTLGCVALEDDAIRALYPRIPVGTRVIIRK